MPLQRPRQQQSATLRCRHGRARFRADRPVASILVDAPGSLSSIPSGAAGWSPGPPAGASSQRPSHSRRWQQPWDMPRDTATTTASSCPRGTHALQQGDCAANTACPSPGWPCFRATHEMGACTMLDLKTLVPSIGDARCGWSNSISARRWGWQLSCSASPSSSASPFHHHPDGTAERKQQCRRSRPHITRRGHDLHAQQLVGTIAHLASKGSSIRTSSRTKRSTP
jgi:hypothetical protein